MSTSFPVEMAIQTHVFAGNLVADFEGRRLIDLLNDERQGTLRLSDARVWSLRDEKSVAAAQVEVSRRSILWVSPLGDLPVGRPEYRVAKRNRAVSLVIPPYEIDAILHVPEDDPGDVPLAGLYMPFFVASGAVIRQAERIEQRPLIFVNRQAISAAWHVLSGVA